MCVLAFAWKAHPRWRLVMIGNRDELHARPSAPLARWDDQPEILAGRDLVAGGTWLGVSDRGRFAVITNVANPEGPRPAAASRGTLVTDALNGEDGSHDDLAAYNRFNLIAADTNAPRFTTNHPESGSRRLGSGICGVSNGALDEAWPKTERIKAMLDSWLEADSGDSEALLGALRSDDSPQVEPERARHSPIFIRNPVYGTRCSTVVMIDESGEGLIAEHCYDARGDPAGQSRLVFQWPLKSK
ncbi:MAG: NRDE family protein [Sphingomonadaceae bacterium]|nr:NRDE family protein [Sphingomonadaceae bacterium]